MAAKYNFSFDTTSNWNNLNSEFLARYQVVVFLDTRPEDLRQNPDIDILLSIDSTSFPLGTGPKPHEIWHSGYYPVVWTRDNKTP